MKKQTLIKLLSVASALAINLLCTCIVLTSEIETTTLKISGSYVSIVITSIACLRFPLRFYIEALTFNVFASSLGSVINLYAYVPSYDLFVHFLSGILLADAGRIIINRSLKKQNLPKIPSTTQMFSFIFSCSGAALWEIYEFSVDNLINANMQGSKQNTMWDIIAGVLGATIYCTLTAITLPTHQNSK